MQPFIKMLSSTLGKKYLMAVTGLSLVGFIIVHLLGNLQLLIPNPDYFNKYAHHLEALGPVLWVMEIGLIGLFLTHGLLGLMLNWLTLKARPTRYLVEKSKGGPSKSNFSSRNMLLLGGVLAAFIVFHVWQFKYGAHYDSNMDDGQTIRDLHKLVIETFQTWWAFFYVAVMLCLGLHLRHGLWSMFQSVGLMPGKISNVAYACGVLFAVLVAIGFILLPLWIFFDILGVYQ